MSAATLLGPVTIAEDSVVDGGGARIIGPETGPALILGERSRVRGFIVEGHDSSMLGAAVVVRGHGALLENCEIRGGPGAGALVLSGGATFLGCTITHSRSGIAARASTVIIISCVIEHNDVAGLELEESSSGELKSSSVRFNFGDGAILGALSSLRAESSAISFNDGYGVRALFPGNVFAASGTAIDENALGALFGVEDSGKDSEPEAGRSHSLGPAPLSDTATVAASSQAATAKVSSKTGWNFAEDLAPALAAAGFHPDEVRLPSDRIAGAPAAVRDALDSPLSAPETVRAFAEHALGTGTAAGLLEVMAAWKLGEPRMDETELMVRQAHLERGLYSAHPEFIPSLPRDEGQAPNARDTIVEFIRCLERALLEAESIVAAFPDVEGLEEAVLEDEPEATLLEEHVGSDETQKRTERLGQRARSFSHAEILRGLSLLVNAFSVKNLPPGLAFFGCTRSGLRIEGAITAEIPTSAGWVVIGGTGPNRYPPGIAVIIDPGGDDVYQDAASVESGVAVVVDMAGNDIYEGRTCASRRGLSVLIDGGGNDFYRGDTLTQGATVGGGALLCDKSGDDIYQASRGAQAFAVGGVAALEDDGGNDDYSAGSFAQAVAGPGGEAILLDRTGSDRYVLTGGGADTLRDPSMRLSFGQGFAMGLRPGAAGGVAMLIDGGGDDYYGCDLFGQGVGYWAALGALVDSGGADVYRGWQYVQGAGIHLAAGVLLDIGKGRDVYQSWTVSQGCGHDLALGVLVDEGGDDLYRADNLTQGCGNSNGIGILVDRSGNDKYILDESTSGQGYGVYENVLRRYGSLGIFLDMSGHDFYSGGSGQHRNPGSSGVGSDRNGTTWKQGEIGVGVDMDGIAK